MNMLVKALLVAASLLITIPAFAAVQAGKDYQILNPPLPTETKKIEVLEFFFYGCSHCFRLHPHLVNWKKTMPKDAELTLVPTIFRDSWEPMARTYYAVEAMGQLDKLHDALYRSWHVDNVALNSEADINTFMAKHDVDQAKFSAAYNSFSMQSKVVRAKQMIRSYGINGTPTLVVDGKYLVTGLHPEETIRVLNELIAMARKDHAR